MTDLYRRLLGELTDRFGGKLDEANADAIAYAAAELYHRDFEPRLWQEKSAHDLLDLFGVPRTGVFAPYSLSDRLVLFQRRSSQEQYITRAHEVLTALGVPRTDENGVDRTLKWRLDRVLETVNDNDGSESGDQPDDAAKEVALAAPDSGSGAATADGTGVVPEEGAGVLALADGDKTSPPDPEAGTAGSPSDARAGRLKDSDPGATVDAGGGIGPVSALDGQQDAAPDWAEESEQGSKAEPFAEVDGDGEAGTATSDEPGQDLDGEKPDGEATELEEAGLADGAEPVPELEDEPGTRAAADEAEKESEAQAIVEADEQGDSEAADEAEPMATDQVPAQLVEDAVRALEQAAEVEARLAESGPTDGPGGGAGSVDLRSLTETLNGIQGEIAALRDLVEAFEIGMRRQLDEIQSQLRSATDQTPVPPSGPSSVVPHPSDPTQVMAPVEVDVAAGGMEGEVEGSAHRRLKRVFLVLLLALLGVALAGGIAVAVAVGWDSIRPKPAGLLLPF